MASIKNDPQVVELLTKQSEKSTAAARKQAIADVKTFVDNHVDTIEDNTEKKVIKAFGKALIASLKS